MLDKLDLVVEIEELLEECGNYPFGDDYHDKYPCELIISPSIDNGEFTIENFLLWQDFIELTTWEEFLSDVEMAIIACEDDYPKIAKQYQDFIDFIQSNLQNIQIYKVRLEEIKEGDKEFEEAHIYCAVGSIENFWLGLIPRINNEWYYGNSLLNTIGLTPETNKIINRLKSDFQESFNLLSIATEAYLVDTYKIKITDTRQSIIEKLLNSGCYCWTKEYKPNFGYKIGGKIGKLLINNLLEVKKYYIWGYDGWFIYIGGIAQDGDWIGLYTRQEYSY